jgi:adenylate cyclase
METTAYLAHLNRFLEAMAGAIVDHGGEILSYIGDAVLAIFPISTDSATGYAAGEACARAIDAAREVAQRIAAVNSALVDVPAMQYGIGLHIGDVTYGNIGIPQRLQFTVIGPAANEASRIEGMTKELSEPVLVSRRFAQSYSGELVSRGMHALKGVVGAHELFALPALATPATGVAAG